MKQTRVVVMPWNCEISDPHGSEYEDGGLQGCYAVWSGISLSTFQRCLLPAGIVSGFSSNARISFITVSLFS
jgi:hypothetical protein